MEAAIYMSTAGMNLCYGIETTSGVKPIEFHIIQGATSLSEISSEKEQIEVTPLSATDYKEYVGGLADPGGVWEVGFNESNVLHETWSEIVEAYRTATVDGLRMWFQAYHPKLDEAFFVVGEPNILGFGGAEVAGVYTNTARITLNQVAGWSEAIEPTEEE